MLLRHVLRLSSLFFCMLILVKASPVYAQDFGLEEIVVTAQKRETSLQDTPIAVSAFTANALENKGIENISEIAQFTPNLVFDTTSPVSGLSSGAVVFIRGVGNTDFSLTTDPGVGTYVDGVYVSRSAGGVLDVLDVERIEVLRGPQGTLFGRNTIGGAINITSRKPADELQGAVELTAGNFNRLDARASVDIPFSDTFRSNFALSSKQRDGFVDRVLVGDELGNEDKFSFRGNFVWEATDNLDFQLSVDHTDIDEASAGSTIVGFTQGGSIQGYDFFRTVLAPVFGIPDGTFPSDLNQFINRQEAGGDISFGTGESGTDLEINGLALVANWRGDNWALKYTGARRETDGSFNRDADNTPVQITETRNLGYDHEQTSHELQLTGELLDGRVKYVAGLYDFEEQGTDNVFVDVFAPPPPFGPGVPVLINNFADVDNTSEAIYAQLSIEATERLGFTLGARYTEDTKRFKFSQYISAPNRGPLPVPIAAVREDGMLATGFIPLAGNGSGDVSQSFDETSIQLGADYTFDDGTLAYYSYSEGFKSGGFVLRYVAAVPAPLAFNPELLSTHEVGLKWQGWSDRLRVNAAAYSTDYDDVQVTFFDAGGGPITANAGEVDIKGLELEVTALLSENLLFEFGYGYTDAEYSTITNIPGLALTIDRSAKLVNTPENTLNLGAEYSLPLARGGEVALRLDYRYNDDIFNDSQNSPFLFQESYDVWNASIRYQTADERITVKAFVENLGDERYIESGDSNFGLGFHEANYNRPRQYGLTFKYMFGK